MKIQGDAGLLHQAPERLVDRAVVGEPGVAAGHHQRAKSLGEAALRFGQGPPDLIRRNQPDGQITLGHGGEDFVHPFVVDTGEGKVQLGIVETAQGQQFVGKDHLRVHTVGRLFGDSDFEIGASRRIVAKFTLTILFRAAFDHVMRHQDLPPERIEEDSVRMLLGIGHRAFPQVAGKPLPHRLRFIHMTVGRNNQVFDSHTRSSRPLQAPNPGGGDEKEKCPTSIQLSGIGIRGRALNSSS